MSKAAFDSDRYGIALVGVQGDEWCWTEGHKNNVYGGFLVDKVIAWMRLRC